MAIIWWKVIVENGHPHYAVTDGERTIHCELNELNETIEELQNEAVVS